MRNNLSLSPGILIRKQNIHLCSGNQMTFFKAQIQKGLSTTIHQCFQMGPLLGD